MNEPNTSTDANVSHVQRDPSHFFRGMERTVLRAAERLEEKDPEGQGTTATRLRKCVDPWAPLRRSHGYQDIPQFLLRGKSGDKH